MKSSHWQTEIEGLAAIVRLIKYHKDIIQSDLSEVMNDLRHECKNLRSQVTRSALQTFVVLFTFLGRSMEASKVFEGVIDTLLSKTADTNR